MIEFFSGSLISVSVVILLLLSGQKILLKQFGAQVRYQLWLLVPLAILFSFLPSPEVLSVSVVMDTLVVSHLKEVTTASISASDTLLLAWLIGMLILFSALTVAHVQHCSRLKASLKPYYSDLISEVDGKPLPTFISSQLTSPMLVGFWKTTLILPRGFDEQYSLTQQKLILAHENYHYGRFDIYWNYFAMLLLLVFWFHPLAWLAYFRFRQDQELSCDQAVLVNQPTKVRQQYARALLQTAEQQQLHIAYLSFGKSGDNKMLKERIQNLQKPIKANPLLASALLILGSLVLASSIQAKSTDLTEQVISAEESVDELKKLSAPIIRIAPSYPLEASREGIEGYVVLNFAITQDGHVKDIKIVNSEPGSVFDEAAKQALAKWRYAPHQVENASATIQLDFKLSE